MTIPAAFSKTGLEDGATDTPATGRQSIEDAIDKLNTLRTHFLASAITSGTSVLGVGTGLTSSGGSLNVNVGTGIGQIVQLANVGGSAGLPAVDGSQLTGVAGGLLQFVIDQDGTPASGSAAIPTDDTIPQNTEGTEFQTVTITPKSASSTLIILHAGLYSSASGGNIAVAMFKDSDADAIAATVSSVSGSGLIATLFHSRASGITSAQTFKIRAGLGTVITSYFNRMGTTQVFGATQKSMLAVLELAS